MKSSLVNLGSFVLATVALAGCNVGDDGTQKGSNENVTGTIAMQTVTSTDGTKIAFEKLGNGPPVILVNGALAARSASSDLARLLAPHFTT